MSDFEQNLTKAMQRVNAPETLAKFLLAAVEAEAERNRPRIQRKHTWVWSMSRPWFGALSFATAALLLAGVFTGKSAYDRHQREALATQQFETAARITDKTLEHTREQLAKAGVLLEQ